MPAHKSQYYKILNPLQLANSMYAKIKNKKTDVSVWETVIYFLLMIP